MQPLSRDIVSYAQNLRRTAVSLQARQQMLQRAGDGRQALVMNPYNYGVEQSSPMGSLGKPVDPEPST